MLSFPIKDNMFSHVFTSSWYNKSELMKWKRENLVEDYIFSTDPYIQTDKKVYVWLLESPEVTASYYDYVLKNPDKFSKIFTFSKEILESCKNSYFLPIGGCWIKEKDRKIYEKSKLISLISSEKNFTTGHKLRRKIVDRLTNRVSLYGPPNNHIENKITGLKDYMFQIVVENNKSDYFFTEKLIDCLQTGVIPIYWGCPSIGDFFDTDGILSFDTMEDLEKILESLSKELYESKKKSIETNFEKSKEYIVAENYLVKNYFTK
jgi:hypothetical protein